MSIPLATLEAIVDASGAARAIRGTTAGRRPGRQLTTRTLLTGMLLSWTTAARFLPNSTRRSSRCPSPTRHGSASP